MQILVNVEEGILFLDRFSSAANGSPLHKIPIYQHHFAIWITLGDGDTENWICHCDLTWRKCHERQAFSFGLLIQATPHPSFTQEHGNFGCFVGRSSLRCRNVVGHLGCGFPVNSADFWLCLHKFCGLADRGRLVGQWRKFKTCRKSTAQSMT